MNNKFNLEEFAKMFDAALASDNPAVKKALRNFMMVAAIVHAQEDDERQMGPLETLVKKVSDLERIVSDLQNTRTWKDHKEKYYQDYYNNPTWVYQQPTTSVSTTSSQTWKDTLGYSAEDIHELMKDLKFNENKSD
jgi:endonuclease III